MQILASTEYSCYFVDKTNILFKFKIINIVLFLSQIVRASNNVLSSVKSMGKVKCLEEIYLSSNRLTDLSHIVGLFPALQILDVENNHIETWQQVVRFFPPLFCLLNKRFERSGGPLDEIVNVYVDKFNVIMTLTSFDSRDMLPRHWAASLPPAK